MKIIGIIPARAGSKGIPGKNKKMLAGKPLIAYTFEAALKAELDKIVVSTDDEYIMELASAYGIEIVKRPKELTGDEIQTLPVLQHVLATQDSNFDAVMTLQPTSPFRTNVHINTAIKIFKVHPEADSLVSIVKVPHHFTPSSLMKLNDGLWLENLEENKDLILRRQDKPVLWARNGAAIYITKTNNIDNYIFGGKILGYQMSKIDSIDIDDHEDWEIAEMIMEKQKS